MACGLDRLLLGVAMSDDGLPLFGRVLPFDDVSSGAVDLIGRFAELVERLGQALDNLTQEQSLKRWMAVLAEATDDLANPGTATIGSWTSCGLSSRRWRGRRQPHGPRPVSSTWPR